MRHQSDLLTERDLDVLEYDPTHIRRDAPALAISTAFVSMAGGGMLC